jgi:threonine aldolase
VFAQIPQEAIKKIQERDFFYVWSEEESVARWMCSFDTTDEDVREFAEFVRNVVRDLPS